MYWMYACLFDSVLSSSFRSISSADQQKGAVPGTDTTRTGKDFPDEMPPKNQQTLEFGLGDWHVLHQNLQLLKADVVIIHQHANAADEGHDCEHLRLGQRGG